MAFQLKAREIAFRLPAKERDVPLLQKVQTGDRVQPPSYSANNATSRKLAGSIPDGVIGIFHCHNPSGFTMVLGSTQPLTEMSTKNISWG